jgi:hypothetical protein
VDRAIRRPQEGSFGGALEVQDLSQLCGPFCGVVAISRKDILKWGIGPLKSARALRLASESRQAQKFRGRDQPRCAVKSGECCRRRV